MDIALTMVKKKEYKFYQKGGRHHCFTQTCMFISNILLFVPVSMEEAQVHIADKVDLS